MNEQKIDDNSKKKILKFSIFWVAWIVLALWIGITVPIIKKHFEIENLKKDIQKIELEIQLNKEEWTKCESIMKTAHESNEVLRWQQLALQQEYNRLVGFTMASDKE